MTNMDATHEKIMETIDNAFQGLSTADLSFAIGYLEAMKLGLMLEEGRISYEEYMEAIGLAA